MLEGYLIKDRKTKFGIDQLDVAIMLLPIIESRGNHQASKALNRFKSFLVQKLKRGITSTEEINLMQGLLDYVRSEPGTNERMKAINYLNELEFLQAPAI